MFKNAKLQKCLLKVMGYKIWQTTNEQGDAKWNTKLS
jgi:hypothetical protein